MGIISELSNGKRWCLGVMAAVVAPLPVLLFVAWAGHFAQAGDDHVKLSDVEKLAIATNAMTTQLFKRATAEDAGKDRDRVRCMAGQIKSCDICGNAGVQLDMCK